MKNKWNKSIAFLLVTVLLFVFPISSYASNQSASNIYSQVLHFSTPQDNYQEKPSQTNAVGAVGAVIGLIELLELLGWLAAATIVLIEGKALVDDVFQELYRNSEKTEFKYHKVSFNYSNKSKLLIGEAMNKEAALAYYATGKYNDVWTAKESDAIALARAASGGLTPKGQENHYDSGYVGIMYYNHYHDTYRTHGHVFYGMSAREGKNPRTLYINPFVSLPQAS
ncbi:hypothetical protein MH117_14250 [Paenibacillus sp. ACRRX]|uniref:hypothetical protein n=1 Tax=Paenibacillus sp. ACRRX TaxID=2918206 RepID=UPI001EF45F20|nr:hypothetical protein [Paenibacillus sp. ACRRX]MCG7408589.1 hypothetical protein [Paenibacillus sp. ACRRX]